MVRVSILVILALLIDFYSQVRGAAQEYTNEDPE
jgi:hypothetical protein